MATMNETIRKGQEGYPTEAEAMAYRTGFKDGAKFTHQIDNLATITHCPQCAQSLQGESFFDIYKTQMATLPADEQPTDEEILTIIKQRHNGTHALKLLHVVEANKYVCPHCATAFIIE